ncbi:MAG: hypothetical protein CR967_04180 [Proteobacteria bacterium]|nr:MAG: hypothetical protein CR967_04180 [Pseudomonadota bacterium]
MSFNVKYKDEAEIIDYCVPNLKAISSLMDVYGRYAEDYGIEEKSNVFGFLDSLLFDIANGLEKYANEKIKVKK